MTAISRPSRSRPAVSTRWLTIGLFVLPALVLYAVFVILPVLRAMQYSLYKWNGLTPLTDFVGLQNYVTAFGNKLNTDGVGLSTVAGTEATVTDPNLQAVLAGRGDATFMQLYLDQATSGALSQAFNDATIALFLGQSSPEEVCQALTDAAAAG